MNTNTQGTVKSDERKRQLFIFGEQLSEICDNISKGCAVTGMASEAMENMYRNGTTFTGNEILDTINVIYDYIDKANGLSSELYDKFQSFRESEIAGDNCTTVLFVNEY